MRDAAKSRFCSVHSLSLALGENCGHFFSEMDGIGAKQLAPSPATQLGTFYLEPVCQKLMWSQISAHGLDR